MDIILCFAFGLLWMTGAWCWYWYSKNPAVVDVAWAAGLLVLGIIDLAQGRISKRTLLFGVILVFWGLRLAGFLWWTRVRLNHHDKRYTELATTWKGSHAWGFFLNYQLQGVLFVIISLPWLFIARVNTWHYVDIVGILMAIGAIVGESIADMQLQQFKRNHPGQVCNQGLWRYSRHPNYFFEWLTWCGFALGALASPWGWLAFVSPITLYLIMTRVTMPLTEQGSIQSRGDAYRAYQRITPAFFPMTYTRTRRKA